MYLLSNNKDLFSLMIAKKNGEPKTDYPGIFFNLSLKMEKLMFLEFDKGQLIHNSGSSNFFLRIKDKSSIVWLSNKPIVISRRELNEQKLKSEQDLTDSKSSEASFCGHYSNSLSPRNTKCNEEEIARSRKPQKRQSLFFRIFCSFSCFN